MHAFILTGEDRGGMKPALLPLLALCLCLAGCGGKETGGESTNDDNVSGRQDDSAVPRQPKETAAPFETIELKYLEQPGARYVVPVGEKWKLIWNRPLEYGPVTPAYDVRFKGSIVLGNNETIAVSGVAESGINILALSKKKQSVVVWAYEGANFYSANEYVKAKIEKYKVE